MAQGGLRKWVEEKWVDIGAPKKDGKYQPCGRKSAKVQRGNIPNAFP
jgi:predicted PP-loop superfamily ATPase